MAHPRRSPESEVLHCGWTDPRDRVNWHLRSFRDAAGVWMLSFRRSDEDVEVLALNRFERGCDQLEDHQIAMLLDQATRASRR